MYRDEWIMSMKHFSKICDAANINNNIILFDVHNIHFDDISMIILKNHHAKTFVLKSGNSWNDYLNEYGMDNKWKQVVNNLPISS